MFPHFRKVVVLNANEEILDVYLAVVPSTRHAAVTAAGKGRSKGSSETVERRGQGKAKPKLIRARQETNRLVFG